MNRKIIISVGLGVVGIICIAIFFLVLSFYAGPIVFAKLWEGLPAITGGLIGGTIGALISLRRRPDERAMHIMKDAARNAWVFFVLVLPYLSILLFFTPAWNGVIAAIWLYVVWFMAFVIFGATVLYYYWK